jgi:hypothetical protein
MRSPCNTELPSTSTAVRMRCTLLPRTDTVGKDVQDAWVDRRDAAGMRRSDTIPSTRASRPRPMLLVVLLGARSLRCWISHRQRRDPLDRARPACQQGQPRFGGSADGNVQLSVSLPVGLLASQRQRLSPACRRSATMQTPPPASTNPPAAASSRASGNPCASRNPTAAPRTPAAVASSNAPARRRGQPSLSAVTTRTAPAARESSETPKLRP